ncbi:MAG: tetratricopeptide repeat protein [Planctomycetes bacterium]|nr:tetratricopeptide repeat protein [Planctomycetota bacterium]
MTGHPTDPARARVAPAWLADRAFVALLLVLAVLVTYLPAIFGAGFHFDDHHSFVQNENVRSATFANLWRFFEDPTTWSAEPGNVMYRPLQVASYAIDYAVWNYRPTGWVLTNALLHAAVAVLVWRLAARLGLSPLASFLGGLVFALHPANSEVVNYVSSRSESLAALLMLSALHAHLSARRATGAARAGLVVLTAAAYALSMTAKETPALFFAGVAWMELLLTPGGAVPRLKRAAGFGVIYLLAFGAIMLLRRTMLGVAVANVPLVTTAATADHLAGGQISVFDNVLMVQSRVVVIYLQVLLRPAQLNVDYDISRAPVWTSAAVVALALHASVVGWAVREALRGRRLVPLCVGWFWLFIVPSVAFPLNVVMNEHRLYLPMIAVALFAGAALGRVAGIVSASRGTSLETSRGFLTAGLPLLLFIPLAVLRSREWRSDEVLWTAAVQRAPGSARAHMHLGAAYQSAQSALPASTADTTLLDRAIAEYRISDSLHPNSYDTHLNLGNSFIERGRITHAPADFEAALEAFQLAGRIVGEHWYRPRFWQAQALAELERYDEALRIIRDLRDGDDSKTTLYDDAEARLLRRRGDKRGAEAPMLRVIGIEEPEGKVDGLLTLGTWRFEDGDVNGAREMLDRALKIANARTDEFRPFLHAARMLQKLGYPGADKLVESAVRRGWTAEPDEVKWVQGGPTPGAMRGTRAMPTYGRPK